MSNKLNAFKKLVEKVVGKKAKDVSKMEFNKMNDFTIKEFGLSTGFLSDAFDKEMQKYCANSVFF